MAKYVIRNYLASVEITDVIAPDPGCEKLLAE
ncbi:Uncharacterised protein [Escherichia coli]|uniref:Uncharacterized protein n=1 Tax=Escherichia coli TaxID=562 RepID=A0A376KND7_ECOLX|nr:Uncharacterised protein [Escherichia coli]